LILKGNSSKVCFYYKVLIEEEELFTFELPFGLKEHNSIISDYSSLINS